MHSCVSGSSSFKKFGASLVVLAATCVAPAAWGTVPGSVAGAFSVDPTGSANYVIPIAVPPGVAGVQPDLKLLYSSRGPDSQLGMGWSLSGLSAITRCPRTFDQDNFPVGVNFDPATDKFCLDGQRLSVMSGGTYGANLSRYRTEIESYHDVASVGSVGGGPQHFVVHDRAGMTYTYGVATGCLIAASNSACVLWPVTRAVDRFGNFISYTYATVSTSEYKLTEIDYGNVNGTIAGKVTFTYVTTRPDKYFRFAGNSQTANSGTASLNTTVRLSSISVFASPTSTLVRQYTLGYSTSTTGRSLLSSVTQCSDSAGTNCLPATTFGWGQTPGGFQSTNASSANVLANVANLMTGDFDGDGITDYIYNNGGTWYLLLGKAMLTGGSPVNTGLSVGASPQYALVGDINGDGCSDLIEPDAMFGTTVWVEFTSDCAGHLTLFADTTPTQGSESKHPVLVDINGDGIDDLIYRAGGTLWVAKGSIFSGIAPGVDTGLGVTDGQLLYPLNFYGNGHPQIYVGFDSTGTGTGGGGTGGGGGGGCGVGVGCQPQVVAQVGQSVSPMTATATVAAGTILDWSPTSVTLVRTSAVVPALLPQNMVLLDSNGDGLTDLASFFCTGNQCGWYLYVNQGGNWVWNQQVFSFTDTMNATRVAMTRVMDYDGDGQQDLVYPSPTGSNWVVLESNGTQFASAVTNTGVLATNPTSALVVDYDGDGLLDLMFPGTMWEGAYIRGAGKATDMITQVTDGLGRNTYVEYQPLNTPWISLYGGPMDNPTTPNLSAPAVRNYLGPLYVVSQFGIESATPGGAAGSIINTDYAYWGAKVDVQGRGFLGFYQAQATNLNSGIITVNTTGQQVFPYTGMVTESDVYAVAGPIHSVDNTNIKGRLNSNCVAIQGEQVCQDGAPPAAPMPGTPALNDRVDQTVYTLATEATTGTSGISVFPFVQQSVRKRYDLHANDSSHTAYQSITMGYTYNGWGEATQVTATTTDSQAHDSLTVTTANTYGADDTTAANDHWALSRLTDATVTQTYSYKDNTGSTVTVGPTVHESTFTYATSPTFSLLTETANVGSSTPLKTTYTYDPVFGNKLSATQTGSGIPTAGYKTSTAYDANGLYAVSATNALGQVTQYQYDSRFGSQSKVTDPNGLIVSTTYDAFGRKATQSGPRSMQNVAWTYLWCPTGTGCRAPTAVFYLTENHSDGQVLTSQFDAAGRTVMKRSLGLGSTAIDSFTVYDPLGRAYMGSNPAFDTAVAGGSSLCWTYNVYDMLGRTTEVDAPAQGSSCNGPNLATAVGSYRSSAPTGQVYAVTTSGYDGLQSTVTDPNGHAATRIDDAMAKTWKVSDPIGGTATYGYDAFGDTTDVWLLGADGMTSHTHMSFDVRGFKTGMVDQDMGTWSYSYDSLGRLSGQTDANGQVVALSYDALGRLIRRVEQEGTTSWCYDAPLTSGGVCPNPVGTTTQTNTAPYIGKLSYVAAPAGYSAAYTYDSFGDAASSTVIPGMGRPAYTLSRSYDPQGRLSTLTYPTITAGTAYTLGVTYCYDSSGHMNTVFDASTGQVCGSVSQYLWQAQHADERDNVTEDNLGASSGMLPMDELRSFDAATGHLSAIGVTGATTLEAQAYSWDLVGNFSGRSDSLNGTQETVAYDSLNRMASSTLTVGSAASGTFNYAYDSMGNLRQRDTVATNYVYQQDATPGASPHTLSSVNVNSTPIALTYDSDGNVLTEGSRGLTWSSYDKPVYIADSASGITEQFMYGPDRELYQQVDTQGAHTVTTTHLWGLVDVANDSVSGQTVTLSITAGSLVIAQQVLTTSAPGAVFYLLHDAMGSVIQQAYNNAGSWTPINGVAYGPWGDSRNPGTGVANLLAYSLPTAGGLAGISNLGFTGHTNLSLGLVHMGGRVYDPMIGRFLSADPNVQFPLSPQSYNRYAYVNNNPLSFTDPTGYLSFGNVLEAVAIIVIAYFTEDWAQGEEALAEEDAGITAATATTAQAAAPATVGALAGGATAGFLSTPGDLGDRLGGALGGGLEGGIFANIGEYYDPNGANPAPFGSANYFEKAAEEGLIGGIASEAGGGRFGDGFLGSAVGSLSQPLLGRIGAENVYDSTIQAMVAATIGGTLSDIAGGSFADGAVTAAFQNLFNDQTEERKEAKQERLEAIANNPTVKAAIAKAWDDSNPNAPTDAGRKEHAFWVLKNNETSEYSIVNVSEDTATNHSIVPGATPVVDGESVVAYFHTHPNPHFDGDFTYDYGPSPQDVNFSLQRNMPLIIQARDGLHFFTPP